MSPHLVVPPLTFVLEHGQLLTANQRPHWTVRSRRTRYLRSLAKDTAQALRVPALRRARIVAWVTWPDRRRRDVHNLMPTLKALVDGLVDAGVLPDDSDAHLEGPDPRATPGTAEPGRADARPRDPHRAGDHRPRGGGAPMPNHDYDRPARCDSCGGVIRPTGECACSD